MIKFIETIKVLNGDTPDIKEHVQRVRATLRHFYSKSKEEFDLILSVSEILDREREKISNGLFKLRVVYSDRFISGTLIPYIPKTIKRLKVVECDAIDYPFKFENRTAIESLLSYKDNCDDILIVKKGVVTDTSYSNIVFERMGSLYTPESYLLAGTKRAKLIRDGIISEEKIRPCDIDRYDKAYLINSMLDLYPVEEIEF
ncbi:MAG: aminotransferase class IV [Bacteroidales bacterium]